MAAVVLVPIRRGDAGSCINGRPPAWWVVLASLITYAVAAVLASIHAARRDGVGRDCDVSLFEVAPTDDSLESVFAYLVSRR